MQKMVPLTLNSLEGLDRSKAMIAFNSMLQEISKDCLDRPGDKHARSLTMKAVLKPVVNEDGGCDGVKVSFEFVTKVPKKKTRDYDLLVNNDGKIFYERTEDSVDVTATDAEAA